MFFISFVLSLPTLIMNIASDGQKTDITGLYSTTIGKLVKYNLRQVIQAVNLTETGERVYKLKMFGSEVNGKAIGGVITFLDAFSSLIMLFLSYYM